MNDVSTFRLYVLRATYLLMVVGLGSTIWPGIVQHPPGLSLMNTVVRGMLGALSLLAVLGIRYPLQMLPLLLFELAWKSIWLIAFALPLWLGHRMDPATAQTTRECLLGIVIFPLSIPWPHVWRRYVVGRGERWKGAPSGA